MDLNLSIREFSEESNNELYFVFVFLMCCIQILFHKCCNVRLTLLNICCIGHRFCGYYDLHSLPVSEILPI